MAVKSEPTAKATVSTGKSAADRPKKTPKKTATKDQSKEIDGPKGLDPTRYGDWEKGGRCIDF
jgi:shikimate dehydrogenase